MKKSVSTFTGRGGLMLVSFFTRLTRVGRNDLSVVFFLYFSSKASFSMRASAY